ncbi:mitochondrial carrier [Rhodofomes roseus]|uniref:Mitochondrial carrier n=1 Tax=Rhodofomes roseus TaxID=34475 RepID=A0ABQ8K2D2_9APHY|nr:mitochondrial carrier [Rhodofomes roseus]KAH9830370.1 mitochondrial carrier [Rhodofomes roseus]
MSSAGPRPPHTPRPKDDKQSFHYIIRSGIAGGTAGCIAKTVVAPLDRVKILFQASSPEFQKYAGTWSGAFRAASQIYQDNGARGLLQGHSATLLRIFPYAAIKFIAYDQVEHILMPTRESQTNARRFAAGAISGMVSVFFTYPLELIRVRMAFSTRAQSVQVPHTFHPPQSSPPHRPSFLAAMSQIYHEGASAPPHSASGSANNIFTRVPVVKFYRGFSVTLVGIVPYAGTSFLTWGFLQAYFAPPPDPTSPSARRRPSPLADLTFGAVAGAVSQTVSYPFEVVRRRMQVGGLTHPERWMHWSETVRNVWATRGWKGFYVGLSIGYLKIVPMTAVSFTVWQWGKRVLGV